MAYGHLTTPADRPVSERLGSLWVDLRDLLADLKPDVMVVERVLFQVNARTAMSVGQASGLALVAAAQAGCPVAEYSPNEVKLAVAGYGAATKRQVQVMVQVLLGLDQPPSPADRADALALAVCGGICAGARRFLPRGTAGAVQVVGRVSLSPKHTVYLLRVGRRVLLVGTGPQAAPSLISELDDYPEPEPLPADLRGDEP